ncbi:unnamed protein product, partial [Ectocarpus fasciculatus]
MQLVEDFTMQSKSVSLVISKLPEEVILKKKKQLDAEVVAEKRRDAQDNIKSQANLLYLENEARERVHRLQEKASDKVRKEKEAMVAEMFSREAAIGREFRRAREVLESDLKKEQAFLMEKHGTLLSGEQSISRRFDIKWTVCPQPIEMRIHVMRAVKNKLPKGSYVVMLTQFDRLGGKPLVWSVSGAYGISKDRPATTRPFKHHGRFFDRVLKVEDSTFALCPPAERLKPGNVFIIEVFQLATRRNPVNRVVGWAALPMCTSQFSVVEGRFKLPILRGEHTPSVQHYRSIERTIGDDLNAWLCNIYVEVKHLPKAFLNQEGQALDEYQIEFDYMKKLLSLGGSGKGDGSDGADIENQQGGELDPLVAGAVHQRAVLSKGSRHFVGKAKSGSGSRVAQHDGVEEKPDVDDDRYHDFSQSINPSENDPLVPTSKGLHSTGIARHRGKAGDQNTGGGGGGNDSDDDPQQKGRPSGGGFWNSLVGTFSKGKKADESTALTNGLKSSVDQSGSAQGGRIWGNGMTTDEDDEDEPVEVLEPLVKSKIRFILQEAIGDLWFENWGTFDFYVTLFAYIVTLWLRMLIHYIGQYFFLQAVQTPVYSFKLQVFEIVFKYISTAVPVAYEVALVAIGPLSNIFVFGCLCLLSHLFYQFAGNLPDSASLFVCAYGVWTVLDPFVILIVDVASHNYRCGEYDETCQNDYTSSNCDCFNGDWFKLWSRYHRDEGSGITGLFITFMLYFSTIVGSLLLLYEYLVRVHKDARILDIWRRINASAEDLFIPLDFEISLDELRTICASASAWKGPGGASRRLVVSEYIETDPFDDNFKATTRHFAIYELSMDGKRKLYRHFLKLQDGSIIEIFEQLSIDLSTQYRSV